MSLTSNRRKEVLERADCKSELDEFTFGSLECSHLNHCRDLEEYNTPEMTVLVSTIQHLAYHLIFEGYADKIGLSESNNFKAIRSLYQRVYQQASEAHLSINDLPSQIEKAKLFWWYYLEL